MEVVEIATAPPPPLIEANQICVMGESGAHVICIITLDASDLSFAGIDVGYLKQLICVNPDVEAMFPGLTPAGIQIRSHVGHHLLRDRVHVGGGQTVHMCSSKGGDVAEVEVDEPGTPVYYGENETDFLMVPPNERLALYVCTTLGLDPAHHWVSERFGRYVLESEQPKASPKPLASIVNNNNNVATATDALDSVDRKPISWPFVPQPPTPGLAPAEAFAAKWRSDHDAEIIMPDGKPFHFTVMGSGEGASSVLQCLAIFSKRPDWTTSYRLCYENTLLSALHILPGVKYRMLPK